MNENERIAVTALSVLTILQVVMLAALLTKTTPHPPETTPFFGIGPFIGASLSAAVAAIILRATQTNIGKVLATVAAACALISFGPQKYFDAQFPLIWPAVIAGQIAILALISSIVRSASSDAIRT